MEITLKEGEEIKIKAEKGTSAAYMTVVCINDYILKRNEADVVKDSLKLSSLTGLSSEDKKNG